MHKLYDYACDELKEIEKKADKGLSAAEVEYAAKLTELKKNILKIEKMEGDSEYSEGYMPHYSYRGRRRDSMGRYSSYSMAADDIIHQLEGMMESAPDEKSRRRIRELIDEMKHV